MHVLFQNVYVVSGCLFVEELAFCVLIMTGNRP